MPTAAFKTSRVKSCEEIQRRETQERSFELGLYPPSEIQRILVTKCPIPLESVLTYWGRHHGKWCHRGEQWKYIPACAAAVPIYSIIGCRIKQHTVNSLIWLYGFAGYRRVEVAEWLELLTADREVPGSNPSSGFFLTCILAVFAPKTLFWTLKF